MDKKLKHEPWMPAPYEVAIGHAIQGLNSGTATPDQQRKAMKWIIETLCATYDVTYFPESARNSDFAQGKRWCGQQLVKLSNIKLGLIKKDDDNAERPS